MAKKKENDNLYTVSYNFDESKDDTKEVSDWLKNIFGTFTKEPTCTCNKCCECETAAKQYDDIDNDYEPILYIIVNKDAMSDNVSKYTTISHLTAKMMNDESFLSNVYVDYWLNSHNGYGNTVILECDEETLYDNCMSEYDNLAFVKYIEDAERVAHNNWKLACPFHMGVAFFGLKKEMPKWVKKLQLMK